MSEKIEHLKSLLREIAALDHIGAVLGWDRETYMPPGGHSWRGDQLALLARLRHERITSDELGRLLDDLASEGADLDPESDEARMIKVAKRDYDRMTKLPEKLVLDIAHATSAATPAWRHARATSDFGHYVPFLKRNVELNRERAEAFGYTDSPYDPLVDLDEPGITAARLEKLFGELKAAIVPMVRAISEKEPVDDSMLHRQYHHDTQLKVALEVAKAIGYDLNRGRLDLAPHPFCTGFGLGDIRITTRVIPDFLNACLFAVMHESGHAMYEQGGPDKFVTASGFQGASGGVHESQSRLWENLVGRSRAFQRYLFPKLQEAYPAQLGNVTEEQFYRAINKVEPSYIRVEADEVTYNLHIMLRFEIENELLREKIKVEELEEVWNERFREYMGITPPDSSQGVLQDIHWSSAQSFGVFPSYTLGNIIGTQLMAKAREVMPDMDDKMSRGDTADLLKWLQTNIYRHGRKYTPDELVERTTGKPLGTEAWVSYVKGKYGELYGI